MLEFDARSTGKPSEPHAFHNDAAAHLQGVVFPTATPQVMRAECTFWEKTTAIHAFCAHGAFRGGDRFARHWHDVTRLDTAGFGDAAIANKALAKAVAEHKSIFFAEKTPSGEFIDYHAAVSGGLQLVLAADALKALARLRRCSTTAGAPLSLEAAEAISVKSLRIELRHALRRAFTA